MIWNYATDSCCNVSQRNLYCRYRAAANCNTTIVTTIECQQLMSVKSMTTSVTMKQMSSIAVTGLVLIDIFAYVLFGFC